MATPVRPPLSAGTNSAESKPAKQPAQKPTPPHLTKWYVELSKFVGMEVEVEFLIGDQPVKISGRLQAFRVDSMHCVIDCEDRCVFVRCPLSITRLRKRAKTDQ
jgi:hypothetical protein